MESIPQKEKKHSLFLNSSLMQACIQLRLNISAAPEGAFCNQQDEPFEISGLVIQCLKNHKLFTLKTVIRVY